MSTGDVLEPSRTSVERALEVALAMGDPSSVLLAEVLTERLAVIRLGWASEPWPRARLERVRAGKPTIVMIADGLAHSDPPVDQNKSYGPGGWRASRALRDWSASAAAIFQVTPTIANDYRVAIRLARKHQRLTLIESDAAAASEWARYLTCPTALLVAACPQDGHRLAQETVQ